MHGRNSWQYVDFNQSCFSVVFSTCTRTFIKQSMESMNQWLHGYKVLIGPSCTSRYPQYLTVRAQASCGYQDELGYYMHEGYLFRS